ncbi:MAG: hypothetical protein JJD92_08430 [Frankiaceae bacterium]|nr:hypothetical protein [Frankiaceae bacterium]
MRRALIAMLCLLTAVSVSALGAPAQAEPPAADQPRHGADAIRQLGGHLAAVAAAHGTTAATLRERLQSDSSLWVDASERLFYVDPAPEQDVAGPSSAALSGTPLSAAQALELHSRPDAARTVYLDFDGVGPAYTGTIGGAWSTRTYTGGDGNAEPYSLDATATTAFSDAEVADIVSIWQRVAEDFAPFDIDVTTDAAAQARIDRIDADDQVYGTRVAITSSATSCGCGGVAYVGVFDQYFASGQRAHSYYQPAFVYNRGAKYAAEAATHEAGHNLGLSHDGTNSTGYYTGHGDWAPIMGVGYYEPISQWSKGEYAGANNEEDDYSVIAANGGPWLTEEAGPTALEVGTPAYGLLGVGDDSDAFTLTVPEGSVVTVAADHAEVSPNVDLQLTITQGGTTLTDDPASAALNPDVATGLGARLTGLAAGDYVITVSRVGIGDPGSSGYSTYGSIGTYTVSASTSDTPLAPPTAPGPVAAALTSASIAVTWSDVQGETSYELQRYTATGTTPAAVVLLAANRVSHVDSPGAGTWRYRLRALNSAGASDMSAFSTQLTIAKQRGKR